jgi:hypothetical protein
MKAIIDSSSLNDPTILNNYLVEKVVINFEPNSNESKYHHNFVLRIEDENLENFISTIQDEIKRGWYAFCWSEKDLYIIFDSKYFSIDLINGWESVQFLEAQNFGRSEGIEEEYLNFKKYFEKALG